MGQIGEHSESAAYFAINPFVTLLKRGEAYFFVRDSERIAEIPEPLVLRLLELQKIQRNFTLWDIADYASDQTLVELFNLDVIVDSRRFDLQSRYSRSVGFMALVDESLHYSALTRATVLLLGAGAVGSHAAWTLCALGVRRLAIVDFDVVEASNLNRQVLYDVEDIGVLKTEAIEAHLCRINPQVHIRTYNLMVRSPAQVVRLIQQTRPDVVIEAIDTPADVGLWVNQACVSTRTACVRGGFIGTSAVVGPTVLPGRTFCLECANGRDEGGATRVQGIGATFPTVVARTASLMVDECVRIVMGLAPRFANVINSEQYDGRVDRTAITEVRGGRCLTCGRESTPRGVAQRHSGGEDSRERVIRLLFLACLGFIPFLGLTTGWSVWKTLLVAAVAHAALVSIPETSRRHRTAFAGACLYAVVTLGFTVITQFQMFGVNTLPLLFQIGSILMTSLMVMCLVIMISQIMTLPADALRQILSRRASRSNHLSD